MQSYLATIERFFVVLRGQGLMLSPANVRQVETWEQAGIPAEVVCKGLLRGAERYRDWHGTDAALPSSLRYYQEAVKAELEARRATTLGVEPGSGSEVDPDSPVLEALAELAWIGQAEREPRCLEAYRAAWRVLRLRGAEDPFSAVSEANRVAAETLWGLLGDDERAAAEQEVARRLEPERAMLGVRGLAERQQALREDVLAEQHGLKRLRNALDEELER